MQKKKDIYIQKYTQKHVTRAAGMALYELEPGDNHAESDAHDIPYNLWPRS